MPSVDHYVSFQALGYTPQEAASFTRNSDCLADGDMLNRISRVPIENIRRGDTISLIPRDDKYRNDWTFIWDGEKAINLEYDIDDYGYVPREFVVGNEFQPDHWTTTIAHNGIFHLSNETKAQMKFVPNEKGDMYCDVMIGGVQWRCYIEPMYHESQKSFDISSAYFNLEPCELHEYNNEHTFFAYMPIRYI